MEDIKRLEKAVKYGIVESEKRSEKLWANCKERINGTEGLKESMKFLAARINKLENMLGYFSVAQSILWFWIMDFHQFQPYPSNTPLTNIIIIIMNLLTSLSALSYKPKFKQICTPQERWKKHLNIVKGNPNHVSAVIEKSGRSKIYLKKPYML